MIRICPMCKKNEVFAPWYLKDPSNYCDDCQKRILPEGICSEYSRTDQQIIKVVPKECLATVKRGRYPREKGFRDIIFIEFLERRYGKMLNNDLSGKRD